jgi:hypothetical protein
MGQQAMSKQKATLFNNISITIVSDPHKGQHHVRLIGHVLPSNTRVKVREWLIPTEELVTSGKYIRLPIKDVIVGIVEVTDETE